MKLTNNYTGNLALADGTVIRAGQTLEIDSFDAKHTTHAQWLDDGMLSIGNDNGKAVDSMTVAELKDYITANGGEFDDSDKKPDLLAIAQGIDGDK